jgi:membrane peptidoglycan carboxypeptidase
VERADGDGLVVAPSLVLGSNEISPLAMTGAYAAVGNNGVFCPTSPIESVMDSTGKFLYKLDPYTQCKEVIPSEVNKAVLKALRNTMLYGTASAGRPYDGSDMFAKTGTTDDTMDSWLIGGSSKVTTGIWVGNTLNKVTLYRLYANGTSAPYYRFGLFRDIMTQANLLYPPEAFLEPSEDFLD